MTRVTVRGSYTPDWADTEPDPVPVPTIGWLSWHMGWWWSVAVDHAHGRAPRDLDATAPFPWPKDPQHTVAHMVAWVNAELMKNVAEIGQLRLQRAAARM